MPNSPKWTPLDELRALTKARIALGEPAIIGLPAEDFAAWEREMHEDGSGIVEYWEGE